MIIVIYILIGTFFLYLLALQINKYNEIVFDKFRFRYFALRDRLAMLVVNGELDENSWEYKQLIDTFNFHISATETMSIKKIARIMSDYHSSNIEERKVRLLKKNVGSQAVLKIVVDFMDVTYQLLESNSHMHLRFLRFMRRTRGKTVKGKTVGRFRMDTIEKIKSHREILAA
jgi:hypothetical protein